MKSTLEEFEHVLSAELYALSTYSISRKGIYSTSHLIESAAQAFPDKVLNGLSDSAKLDFCSAGRCLAFDQTGAVGFHVFRALEAVLNEYYQRFVGPVPKLKLRNWGALIRKLKDSSNQSLHPSNKTIDIIEHVKDMYRNPLVHPETHLSPEEALALFDIGKSAIIAMVLEMYEADATQMPLPLDLPVSSK